jgi:hypothetical protein
MTDKNGKRKCDVDVDDGSVGYRKHEFLVTQAHENRALQALARIVLCDVDVLAKLNKWSLLQMLLDGYLQNSEALMHRCQELLENADKYDRVTQAKAKKIPLTKVAPKTIKDDLKFAAHLVKYYWNLPNATHNSCGPALDSLVWDINGLPEGCDNFITRIKKALAQGAKKRAKISTPDNSMVPPELCAPPCAASSSAKAGVFVAPDTATSANVQGHRNNVACAVGSTTIPSQSAASSAPAKAAVKTQMQPTGRKAGKSNHPYGEPGKVKAWHNNAWHPAVQERITQVQEKTQVNVDELEKKTVELLKLLPYEVALVCLNKRINAVGTIKKEDGFFIKNCTHLINQWGLTVAPDDNSDTSEDDGSDGDDGSNDEGATEHDGESSGVAASHGGCQE